MTTAQIFGLQIAMNLIVYTLVARWYIAPQLAAVPLGAALMARMKGGAFLVEHSDAEQAEFPAPLRLSVVKIRPKPIACSTSTRVLSRASTR
jgi:hypothetical protein